MLQRISVVQRAFLAFIASGVLATTVQARQGQPPYSWGNNTKTATEIPQLTLAAVDSAALVAEDERTLKANGAAVTKRLRVAIGNNVRVQPQTHGLWETLPSGAHLWRLRVHAEGATDFNFGFARFQLPAGATLHFISASEAFFDGPYGSADNNPARQLWSPLIPGNAASIELYLPAGASLGVNDLELSYVGSGYRDAFLRKNGPGLAGAGPSGNCNIDVACSLGDSYRNEIRAVAKYTFVSGATYLCTGTLVMDQPGDFRNYFLTANHCISTIAEANTMTLYWNYQSPNCGDHGGGSLLQNQIGGATYRASRADVDFSLVELNSKPDSSYNVYYAGWDSSGAVPNGSIGIHHPRGWVKAITQNIHAPATIDSCIGSGTNTHWETGPYAQGTTEGGSSGSAIFVPSGDSTGHQNLITGTLSGGGADCSGSVPNGLTDCYGKLSVAWSGGGSAAQRLKPWLDPNTTNATTQAGGQDVIFFNGLE